MGTRRKRRRAKYKTKSISKTYVEKTPSAQRKEFPKELIEAFVKVSISEWDEKLYKKYNKRVKEFLGKKKAEDKVETGKLVVLLSRMCRDLTEEIKKKQKKLLSATCEEHPNYRAMRSPRSGCKMCWDIYNVKKQKTEKTPKTKKKVEKKKGS